MRRRLVRDSQSFLCLLSSTSLAPQHGHTGEIAQDFSTSCCCKLPSCTGALEITTSELSFSLTSCIIWPIFLKICDMSLEPSCRWPFHPYFLLIYKVFDQIYEGQKILYRIYILWSLLEAFQTLESVLFWKRLRSQYRCPLGFLWRW